MCDLTITRLGEDRFWVVTGGAVGRHDIAWMRRHLPDDGSVVLDRPDLVAVLPGRLGPAGARPRRRAQRRRPLQRRAALHARAGRCTSATSRAARCGCPTSASWAGRSTRRPSSGAGCGTRCGRPARRWASSRAAAPPTTRCAWRRATGSGARTSTRSTTPTRPAWAGPCGWARTRTSSAARRAAAIKERGVTRRLLLPGHRRPRGHARRQGAAARRRRVRSAT